MGEAEGAGPLPRARRAQDRVNDDPEAVPVKHQPTPAEREFGDRVARMDRTADRIGATNSGEDFLRRIARL